VSEILRRVQALVLSNDVEVSEHGYEELGNDDIIANEVFAGIATAIAIEEYRERHRVLALQYDLAGRPMHVVWAVPATERRPAVLVSAYGPDPKLWDSDFKRRRNR
jgi:hypothetical protein